MESSNLLKRVDGLLKFLDELPVYEETNYVQTTNRLLPEVTPKNKTPPKKTDLHHSHENGFEIISFNCLSRGNVNWEIESGENNNFKHVSDDLILWENRKPRLQKQIINFSADLICLQEIECLHWERDYGNVLKQHGFDYVVQNAPGVSEAHLARGNMGNAIVFNPNLFELVQEPISRSRCIMAAFRHIPTSKIVHVINCHLQGNPQRAVDRFGQVKSMFKYLRKQIKQIGQSEGIIICGDFNSTKNSAAYEVITKSVLEPSFTEMEQKITKKKYQIEFQFKDSYERDVDLIPSFWNPFLRNAIVDYLFYSSFNLNLIQTRQLCTKQELNELETTSLPTTWNASDHLPIGARYEFGA